MDQRCTTMTNVFYFPTRINDGPQMRMIDQETRHKCTNKFHMPRKTGQEKLLLLTVPTLRQRKKRIQFRSTWTDTHCVLSFTRKGSRTENAGSVKLINVLKLDVPQMSVSRRKCVLQCSNGSTTPGCDATYSLQARRQTRRRATANCDTPHQKVWMRHATDHTANNVASCSKPFKKARAPSP